MPDNDGGCPISHFIIEQKGKFDILFSKVGQTSFQEMVIGNLQEGQKYQFRVKSVNQCGEGSPCHPTEWHTCKSRSKQTVI
jgi:hypothetical protein